LKQVDDNDEMLARYLLGESDEKEKETVETRYIGDAAFYDQLLCAEDDLIDAYTRDELPQSRRKNFERNFLCSPERRSRVTFAESWIAYLERQPVSRAAAKRSSRLASLPAVFRFDLWPAMLRAAAAILVLLVGVGLIAETIRLRNRVNQAESRNRALEEERHDLEQQINAQRRQSQELSAQLERERIVRGQAASPTSQVLVGPGIMSFLLTPGLIRGTAAAQRLVVPPGARLVLLQINLRGQRYASYRAVIRTVEGRVVWSKSELQAQAKGLLISTPSSVLSNDDYVLTLSGISATGATEVIEEYSFSVLKK